MTWISDSRTKTQAHPKSLAEEAALLSTGNTFKKASEKNLARSTHVTREDRSWVLSVSSSFFLEVTNLQNPSESIIG